MRTHHERISLSCLLATTLLAATAVAGEDVIEEEDEPSISETSAVGKKTWAITAEALGGKPIDGVNGELFGTAMGAAAHVEVPVNRFVSAHGGVRGMSISRADSMESTSWAGAHVGPRLRVEQAWFDAHVNYGTSGSVQRSGFDVGVGYDFDVGDNVQIAPAIRYQFGSDPLDQHAQLVMLGIGVSYVARDEQRVAPTAPAPEKKDEDADDDGVLDEDDICPEEHMGSIPDPERDGCPARDRDDDMVLDHEDACPDEPGAPNTDPKRNGCPGLVRVEDAQIKINRPIYFDYDSDRIKPESFEVLTAVLEAMKQLQVKKLRIEGHTDDQGSDEYNRELSLRRAEAVEHWLINNADIDLDDISVRGYGKSRPVSDHDDSKNRRVEFHILDRQFRKATAGKAKRERRSDDDE